MKERKEWRRNVRRMKIKNKKIKKLKKIRYAKKATIAFK